MWVSANVLAQAPAPEVRLFDLPRQSFTIDAQLQDAIVHDVAFVGDTGMWLATCVGLAHYDGVSWTRYGLGYGLPNLNVTGVEFDVRGELWVGTENGLGTFRGGRFVPCPELGPCRVQRLVADSAGNPWLCAAPVQGRSNLARWVDGHWDWLDVESTADDLLSSNQRLFTVRGSHLFELVGGVLLPLPMPPGPQPMPVQTWLAAGPPGVNGALLVLATPTHVAQRQGDQEWQQLPIQAGLGGGPVLALRSGRIVGVPADGREVWLLDGGMHFPWSPTFASIPGVLRGLAEGPDGSLWGYGEGCLVRYRMCSEPSEQLLPVVYANDSAVWCTNGQFVESYSASGRRRHAEVTRLLARSTRGDILACTDAPNRLVILPAAVGTRREHAMPFDASRTLAAAFDHRGRIWLVIDTGTLSFTTIDADGPQPPSAHPALHGLSPVNLSLTPAGPGAMWLCGDDHAGSARLVRLDAAGCEAVTTPEPLLARPQGLLDGRLAAICRSGVWLRHPDGQWQLLTDDVAHRPRWLATVDDLLLIGCDTTPQHRSGLVALAGNNTTHWPIPLPDLVGGDARHALVASNQELFCIDRTGLPILLPKSDLTAGARVTLDADSGLWVSASGRSNRVEGPRSPPRCRIELQTSNPMEDRRIVVAIRGNYDWLPWSDADQRRFSYRWRLPGSAATAAWSRPALATQLLELNLAAGVHQFEAVVTDGLTRLSEPIALQIEVAPMPLQLRAWFPWLVGTTVALLLGLTAHAFVTRRRLAAHASRLRIAVDKRTRKIRSELVRRIKVERHLRHQQRVLALLATGEPIANALEALVIGFEERLVGWRGVALLHQGESLRMVAAPNLTDAQRARLLECKLSDKSSPCVRAFEETRRVVASGPEWSSREPADELHMGALCSQPIISSQGEPLGVLAVLHDDGSAPTREQIGILEAAAHIAALAIESKRGETERQRMQQEMLDAQKLRSLGLLAGGIAHDFNNLLTGILGNAGLARMVSVAGSPTDDALLQVELATNRAADLCSQLLAYSGRGRFTVKPLDLSAVVREMTQMLRLTIPRRVSLDLRLDPQLPSVEADATQTRQVLMNLISNAAEAIGDRDGLVMVTTGVCDLTEAELRRCVAKPPVNSGRYVFVRVADNGCGMSDAVRRSMFDPFFTTKTTGRGLGLAAVLGIVQGHRGAIEIESEPGRGTSITVCLPASDKPAERDGGPTISLPALRGSGLALVVEDEMLVRDLATSLLRGIGYDVVAVADGEQALAEFAAHAADLQLVLLDIVLPRMDGRGVLQQIRQRRRDLPVILSSGNDIDDDGTNRPADPYSWFLKKPYGPHGLLGALREALAKPRN